MGGKRPRQSHGVSVLPDDAGVASVAERHTRETDVLRLSKTHRLEPGGSGPEATRTRVSLITEAGELPDMSAGLRGGRGDVLRGSHGDVAGVESGASSVERSTSEHGNHLGSARAVAASDVALGWAHRRLTGLGWGGAAVVVRGRENRSHGEGRQWFREVLEHMRRELETVTPKRCATEW